MRERMLLQILNVVLIAYYAQNAATATELWLTLVWWACAAIMGYLVIRTLNHSHRMGRYDGASEAYKSMAEETMKRVAGYQEMRRVVAVGQSIPVIVPRDPIQS